MTPDLPTSSKIPRLRPHLNATPAGVALADHGDPGDLPQKMKELQGRLERVGLSPYEARAYIALVAHGYGDADLIAQTADIPRTSAYRILEGLHEKGFALATQGRPRMYKPEAPQRLHDRLSRELQTTFAMLAEIFESIREKGEPQMVYTILGRDRVLAKIAEMLDLSTESFIISTPLATDLTERLEKNFANATKRGVSLQFITHAGQKVPLGAKLHRRSGLLATDAISDRQRALITAPDLSACGYTDNAMLAGHLCEFLRIVMENP
ncbi:MAG: TrmB family transcriptional regulator [Euryarchaeota archaeon]|nr:TrmB family transcriptional regulator [Euryarchaeota archaeon]